MVCNTLALLGTTFQCDNTRLFYISLTYPIEFRILIRKKLLELETESIVYILYRYLRLIITYSG